jgi:hypothetical protein
MLTCALLTHRSTPILASYLRSFLACLSGIFGRTSFNLWRHFLLLASKVYHICDGLDIEIFPRKFIELSKDPREMRPTTVMEEIFSSPQQSPSQGVSGLAPRVEDSTKASLNFRL